MSLEFRCPVCTKLLRVPDGMGGRQAKCPACGNVITVPGAAPGAAPELPPTPGGSGSWAEQMGSGGYTSSSGPQYGSGGGPPPHGPQTAWTPPPAGPPTPMPGAFPTGSLSPQQYLAASRVSAPATWMIVLSIIQIAVVAIIFPLFLLGIGIVGAAAGQNAPDDEIIDLLINLFFNFFNLIIGLACGIVVLLGAIRMKKLQSYGLAMTAAILSIIPCTSPCCFLIGTPIGIWALVVLNDPAIKAAFR